MRIIIKKKNGEGRVYRLLDEENNFALKNRAIYMRVEIGKRSGEGKILFLF